MLHMAGWMNVVSITFMLLTSFKWRWHLHCFSSILDSSHTNASAGVTPEANLRIPFETQIRLNQKSKPWISVAPQKWPKSSNFYRPQANFGTRYCFYTCLSVILSVGEGGCCDVNSCYGQQNPLNITPFIASPRQHHPLDSTTPKTVPLNSTTLNSTTPRQHPPA